MYYPIHITVYYTLVYACYYIPDYAFLAYRLNCINNVNSAGPEVKRSHHKDNMQCHITIGVYTVQFSYNQ